jgi:hypothetical protein
MKPKEAMSAEIQKLIKPVFGRRRTPEWVLLLLLVLGVPWGIWSASVLLGGGDSQLVALDAMIGCFVLLAIGYLGLHGLSGLAWCSVPVLLTLDTLLEFIAMPALRFARGDDLVDSLYVHAMFLTLIGLTAFWIGSLAVKKEIRLRFVPQTRKTSSRVAFMSAAMLVLGVGGKLAMWKVGLYSYLADQSLRESSLWFIQGLTFIGNLLNAALIVSAIEVLGKRSAEPLIKIVFWLAVVFSIGFGVISGMKIEILLPILYLALVYGITNGRIPRFAILFFLLPVLIYPFENAYRYNLSRGYRAQVNTVDGLEALLEKSVSDVFTSRSNIEETGFDDTTSRLSALTYARDAIGLSDPSLLQGDEKVWLAPLYPLVPRVLWKDKPVLNKGQRLSVALGGPSTSSSAVTIIGDLYLMYGTFGVMVGLFLYGICLQVYMNWFAKRAMSERRLFVYILMLMPLMSLGAFVVELVANAVQLGLVFVFMSYVIYGRSVSSLRVANHSSAVYVH